MTKRHITEYHRYTFESTGIKGLPILSVLVTNVQCNIGIELIFTMSQIHNNIVCECAPKGTDWQ